VSTIESIVGSAAVESIGDSIDDSISEKTLDESDNSSLI
jgi:hypothetical protein